MPFDSYRLLLHLSDDFEDELSRGVVFGQTATDSQQLVIVKLRSRAVDFQNIFEMLEQVFALLEHEQTVHCKENEGEAVGFGCEAELV
jgi:hypothetical protein